MALEGNWSPLASSRPSLIHQGFPRGMRHPGTCPRTRQQLSLHSNIYYTNHLSADGDDETGFCHQKGCKMGGGAPACELRFGTIGMHDQGFAKLVSQLARNCKLAFLGAWGERETIGGRCRRLQEMSRPVGAPW